MIRNNVIVLVAVLFATQCVAKADEPCVFVGPKVGYLRGCFKRCEAFISAVDAQQACAPHARCAGITFNEGHWELRATKDIQPSHTHEISLEKVCGRALAGINRERFCSRTGTCLCEQDQTKDCCGDGVCTGPECYHDCYHDCSADPDHKYSCLFDLMHVEVNHLREKQPVCREGACDCKSEREPICCGDGLCTGPENDLNCPQDCERYTYKRKLRRAEKLMGLEEDFNMPVPSYDPPLRDAKYQELLALDDHEKDAVGFNVDGEPSIFISIASFRDDMCRNTIEDALRRAVHPKRLFFGVVEQKMPIEIACMPSAQECDMASPAERPITCEHLDQFSIYTVDARKAAGPTWARHRADRLYKGETFVLQIDAHMLFTQNWDVDMVEQFGLTGNDYAVLTSYPTDTKGHIRRDGTTRMTSVPVICGATFVSNDGVLRNNGAMEVEVDSRLASPGPMLHPFFAAGMSFSRGHRLLRVPNDCCTPMMFMGEELSMLVRAWTRGYDMYSFLRSNIFHIYPWHRSEEPPMFWENRESRPTGEQERSTRRLRALLGLDPHGDFESFGLDGLYGLGKNRTLAQFSANFGIDFKNEKAHNNCKRVTSGHLHRAFAPFLRADGRGIDYDRVPLDFWERIERRQRRMDDIRAEVAANTPRGPMDQGEETKIARNGEQNEKSIPERGAIDGSEEKDREDDEAPPIREL